MSVRGRVDAQCPAGCEPFEAEIWTLVNFAKDPDLKDQIIAGELNLIACDNCQQLFHCQQMVVVMDAETELLAFVFPEAWAAEEARWREKMEADCAQLKQAMGEHAPDYDPALFFGMEALRESIEYEVGLADEVDVARFLIKSLKLEPYEVRPSAARKLGIPQVLPSSSGKGGRHERLVAGLERLLKENSLLASYERCLARLKAEPDLALPPARRSKKS
jgi:hypothetical protein